MSAKTKHIIAIILLWLPGLLIIVSAFAKFAGVEAIVEKLTKIGFLQHFPLPVLALMELICVVLLLIPKTFRIGLLLITAYLGGALSLEISGGVPPPTAGILLLLIWIGAYLKDKTIFGFTSNK